MYNDIGNDTIISDTTLLSKEHIKTSGVLKMLNLIFKNNSYVLSISIPCNMHSVFVKASLSQ